MIGVLAQINLSGLDEASQLGPLFAVLVSVIIVLSGIVFILFKINSNKDTKIDDIRIEHFKKLEQIRLEMIQKEEARNKEARDAERETLQVLNGVNSVLEMSEKMKVNDTQQILGKLDDIKSLIKQ